MPRKICTECEEPFDTDAIVAVDFDDDGANEAFARELAKKERCAECIYTDISIGATNA